MKRDAKPTLTPRLRFPEFRDRPGWNEEPLQKVADFVSERIALSQLDLTTYVSTESILPDFGGVSKARNLPSSGSATRYQANDVLIANIRPYLKKVWYADRSGGASNDVIVVRGKPQLIQEYFPFVLRNECFIDFVMRGAKGVKMPRGDILLMKSFPVRYPSPAEQRKIAACLGSLDVWIGAEAAKLEALSSHKKGLMQQLFPRPGESRPPLRFPEFQNAGVWEVRKISSILVKNAGSASVEDDGLYREIGVRSHGKGLFHKEPTTGKILGEKRVFHVVPNALVINIVFAWEQALAVTTEDEVGFIASHRFPMFVPRDNLCDVAFIQRLFLMPSGNSTVSGT